RYPIVRFQVLESFLGADPGDFEVRLTSDLFLSGIPQNVPDFREGEVWLVEAYRDQRDQQWTTSRCKRTKPVAEADEDLLFLRAWVLGQRLPAQVTGEVWNSAGRTNMAGIQIHLRSSMQTFSATTDRRGQFSFENLDAGVYEAVADLPGSGAPVNIDLVRARCSRIVFTVR
ncbi:MAG: hypothetical protein JWN34_4301, partial [Bryobacterales bacterium]|nr:hypothetical protein [Bryobacterales bacterium]